MHRLLFGAVVALVFLPCFQASAWVACETVDLDYAEAHPKKIVIEARAGEDGEVEFTVHFNVTVPSPRVFASLELRQADSTTLASILFAAPLEDDARTYRFSLAPACLRLAEFTIDEYSVPENKEGGVPYPITGGVCYVVELDQFAAELLDDQ